MRRKTLLVGAIGVVIGVLLSTAVVFAGSLNPSAGPSDPSSQMFTLEQIYARLTSGGNATKMAAFTEPGSGPGSTMVTLDAIYALAWPARVSKTGQTTSSATGDDGDLVKGVALPNPRFTNHGDGTVTDNLTGLMWMENANVGNDCDGADTGTETWANALASAAACNVGPGYASYTDWRLPNVRELQSLIHYGYFNPAVSNTAGTAKWTSGDPFTAVQSSTYWSSNTRPDNSASARTVFLNFGGVDTAGKTTSHYVWPVRGGQ